MSGRYEDYGPVEIADWPDDLTDYDGFDEEPGDDDPALWSGAGSTGPRQEKEMSETFTFDDKGVHFSVGYSGPANVTAGYSVTATSGEQTARGRVSYGSLSRERASVNSLEFWRAPQWLIGICGPRELHGVQTVQIEPPPGFTDWLIADYRDRLDAVIGALQRGEEPKHYQDLWYYELCREAGVDCTCNWSQAALLAALDANKARPATPEEPAVYLLEEVAPVDVISEVEAAKILWTSPAPTIARYYLAPRSQRIGKELFGKIRTAYWNADFLEDMDMFYSPVGWRIFGTESVEILRAAGLRVVIKTREDQDREQREAELALRKAQLIRERDEAHQEREDLQHIQAIVSEHIPADWVTTGYWHPGPEIAIDAPSLDRGRVGQGQFYPARVGDVACVVHYFGNASELFAPRDTVLSWLQEIASRELTPERAEDWLSRYDGCATTEVYRLAAGRDAGLRTRDERFDFLGPEIARCRTREAAMQTRIDELERQS